MGENVGRKRTLALVGHSGGGKTSLAEAMLFNAGAIDRLGKVDERNATLDFEPEEAKRGGSVSAAFAYFNHAGCEINLVDTPGDDNFLFEAISALRAVDGVVMVIDAIDGVKVQGEKVWSEVRKLGLPAVFVVNKMDRELADFDKAVGMISEMLEVKPVKLQLPIGQAENFKGVVDLLSSTAWAYQPDGSGKPSKIDVPADMAEEVAKARETLIEDIAETDDSLMERYLEGEELGAQELAAALAKGVREGQFVAVCCCSALNNMGVQQVMDAIVQLLPSPAEAHEIKGTNPATGEEVVIHADEQGPFCGLVFKTIADPFAGRLSIVRIFSGTLSPDKQLLNPAKDAKERFGQLYRPLGKNTNTVSEAGVGQIVAIPKLKVTTTGDTLCDEKNPVVLPPITPPAPVISYAIEAKDKSQEEKVFAGINRLLEEDPTLKLERDPQTGEAILSGMGTVHIETTLERLRRKFNVEVNLKTPKVPYRETIKGKTRVQGKYKKQTGGRGQYGDTWLEIEPAGRGEGFIFVDEIVGGVIPRQFIPAVEKGIAEAMQEGVLAGYPMVDIKVRLVDGSHHPVDSSELAFKVAGSIGFKKGALQCNPTLLEPIMLLTVTVPEDVMGDVIGDISARRGKVLGIESKGSLQVIRAHVPMAEVLTYQPELTSLTGGRGAFTMEFDHYEEVPPEIQKKIIEQAKAAKEQSD